MPANVVKSKEDERKWKRAKQKVKEQYPNIREGSDEFYERVMGVYKNMNPDGIDKKSSLGRMNDRIEALFGGPYSDLKKIASEHNHNLEKTGARLKQIVHQDTEEE